MANPADASLSDTLPRWDLSPAYSGFDSPEYRRDKEALPALGKRLEELAASDAGKDFETWLRSYLSLSEDSGRLYGGLASYAHAVYSTDTTNAQATTELNQIEELGLALKRADVAFRNALKKNEACLRPLLASSPEFHSYAYVLEEELIAQSRQMAPELEDLSADLERCGAEAWSRLHDSLSSTVDCLWEPSSGERKTVIELRNLAFSADRAVRQKAFTKELECWKSIEIPMAASLNGVKGCNVILDARRGWKSALERAAFQSRMETKTLEALIAALEESQQLFRRYFKAKAKALGLPRLAFYDLFAPIGSASSSYSWKESSDFIVERFFSFDPAMGAFARRAFSENWIDAQPRQGKVGGAYCTDLANIRQSRILCNYEGSFYSLVTVAHELGHAWHHECVKDMPLALAGYPMTLAETASTFAETIVFEDAIARCGKEEKLGLIDLHLRDGAQIIVDILSRFYFEREIFERRGQGEVSPAEFSRIMLEAQGKTYGDALDSDAFHPYMWAVKGHYYYAGLSYYNYPYAFGLLFALALYARFRQEGPAFAASYSSLLGMTGRASCESVAAAAGFDIKSKEFWLSGIKVFEAQIERFENLVGES